MLIIFSTWKDDDFPNIQTYSVPASSKAFKFSSGAYAAFDFYVNNQYIIEYDGETHYQANLLGWHTEEQLKT